VLSIYLTDTYSQWQWFFGSKGLSTPSQFTSAGDGNGKSRILFSNT